MADLITLVRTYRLTAGIADRLRLSDEIFLQLEPLLRFMIYGKVKEQDQDDVLQEIMKAVFKGDDALAKKVGKGKGSDADFSKLEDYVTSLPLNDAPQGDSAGWKKKTTAVLEAITALKARQPGALGQYNLAVDCKACHSVYRPEE